MHRLLHLPIAAIAFSTMLSTPVHAHEEGHGGKSLDIKVETLAKSTKQWDGDLLPRYPTTQPEVTVLRISIPAGVTVPLHTHPVINAAIIIIGPKERQSYPNINIEIFDEISDRVFQNDQYILFKLK